jgi:hypothetical protein
MPVDSFGLNRGWLRCPDDRYWLVYGTLVACARQINKVGCRTKGRAGIFSFEFATVGCVFIIIKCFVGVGTEAFQVHSRK